MPRKEKHSEETKVKIRDYFDSRLTVKDFDKVEDYFGFFEAKKLLKEYGYEATKI